MLNCFVVIIRYNWTRWQGYLSSSSSICEEVLEWWFSSYFLPLSMTRPDLSILAARVALDDYRRGQKPDIPVDDVRTATMTGASWHPSWLRPKERHGPISKPIPQDRAPIALPASHFPARQQHHSPISRPIPQYQASKASPVRQQPATPRIPLPVTTTSPHVISRKPLPILTKSSPARHASTPPHPARPSTPTPTTRLDELWDRSIVSTTDRSRDIPSRSLYSPPQDFDDLAELPEPSSNKTIRRIFSRPIHIPPTYVVQQHSPPVGRDLQAAAGSLTDSGYFSNAPVPYGEWFYHAILPMQSQTGMTLPLPRDSLSGPGVIHRDDRGSWLIRGCSWMLEQANSPNSSQATNYPYNIGEAFQRFGRMHDFETSVSTTGYFCAVCRETILGGFFSATMDTSPEFKLCRACFQSDGSARDMVLANDYISLEHRRQERDESIALAAGHAAHGRRGGRRLWSTAAVDAIADTSSGREHAQPRSDSPTVEAAVGPSTRTCAICADDFTLDQFSTSRMTSTCAHNHSACSVCTQQWIETQLTEAGWDRIRCMECNENLDHADVQRHATPAVFDRYDLLAMRAALANDPDFVWCQNTACGSGQIHEGGDDLPVFHCRACGSRYCVRHMVPWHEGETCHAFNRRMDGQSSVDEGQTMDDATALLFADDQDAIANAPLSQRGRREDRTSQMAMDAFTGLNVRTNRRIYSFSRSRSNSPVRVESVTSRIQRIRHQRIQRYIDTLRSTDEDLRRGEQRSTTARTVIRRSISSESSIGDPELRVETERYNRARQRKADAQYPRPMQREPEPDVSDNGRHESRWPLRRRRYESSPDRRTQGQVDSSIAAVRAIQQTFGRGEKGGKQNATGQDRIVRNQLKSDASAARALDQKFQKEEKARKQKADQEREAYKKRKADEQQGERTVRILAKACPKCHWYIQKSSGCDHVCTRSPEFLYL